jgi:hypothetical protein
MDDGQKTPRGHPDFNSYVQNLRVFIWNGRTDGQRNLSGGLHHLPKTFYEYVDRKKGTIFLKLKQLGNR